MICTRVSIENNDYTSKTKYIILNACIILHARFFYPTALFQRRRAGTRAHSINVRYEMRLVYKDDK